LTGDKREVMAELLESVKTTQLKEAFHKYLPTVLNETRGNKQKTTTLVNNNKPEVLVEKRTVTVTGNRPNNKLTDAVKEVEQTESATDNEILELRRLAGIQK
jgi:carboxypeptidase C (cathepsin A)